MAPFQVNEHTAEIYELLLKKGFDTEERHCYPNVGGGRYSFFELAIYDKLKGGGLALELMIDYAEKVSEERVLSVLRDAGNCPLRFLEACASRYKLDYIVGIGSL